MQTFTTIKPNHFVQYQKKHEKDDTKQFVLWTLDFHLDKYGQIPEKIVMNIGNIQFLGKCRGVIYKKHKIPVDTAKNCIVDNIQLK